MCACVRVRVCACVCVRVCACVCMCVLPPLSFFLSFFLIGPLSAPVQYFATVADLNY